MLYSYQSYDTKTHWGRPRGNYAIGFSFLFFPFHVHVPYVFLHEMGQKDEEIN